MSSPQSLPLNLTTLLRLNKAQINVVIALHSFKEKVDAGTIGKFLNINRAMASKNCCDLNRMGLVDKTREGHTVYFRLRRNIRDGSK